MTPVSRCLAALAAAVFAITLFGTGTAAANDPLTGLTYANAARQISSWNATPVVASSTGTQLQRDDCIVTSWQRSTTTDQMGRYRGASIMLNLNCSAPLAEPGKPGNSLMTPQGQADKKVDKTAQWVADNPEYCAENASDCRSFCRQNAEKCEKYHLDY